MPCRFCSRALFGTDADAPIKQCPVCRIYIERNEGCAQMMCKNCKHTFCWYCLQNLDVSSPRKRPSLCPVLCLCRGRGPAVLPSLSLSCKRNWVFLARFPKPDTLHLSSFASRLPSSLLLPFPVHFLFPFGFICSTVPGTGPRHCACQASTVPLSPSPIALSDTVKPLRVALHVPLQLSRHSFV